MVSSNSAAWPPRPPLVGKKCMRMGPLPAVNSLEIAPQRWFRTRLIRKSYECTWRRPIIAIHILCQDRPCIFAVSGLEMGYSLYCHISIYICDIVKRMLSSLCKSDALCQNLPSSTTSEHSRHAHLCPIFPGRHAHMCPNFQGRRAHLCPIFPGRHARLCPIFPGRHAHLCPIFPGRHAHLCLIFLGRC